MSSSALDRLLGLLLVALGASGLVVLRVGGASGGWVFVAHDVVALALAAAVVVKLARSVPTAVRRRAFGRLGLGLLVAAAVGVGLVGGVA